MNFKVRTTFLVAASSVLCNGVAQTDAQKFIQEPNILKTGVKWSVCAQTLENTVCGLSIISRDQMRVELEKLWSTPKLANLLTGSDFNEYHIGGLYNKQYYGVLLIWKKDSDQTQVVLAGPGSSVIKSLADTEVKIYVNMLTHELAWNLINTEMPLGYMNCEDFKPTDPLSNSFSSIPKLMYQKINSCHLTQVEDQSYIAISTSDRRNYLYNQDGLNLVDVLPDLKILK